MTEKPAWVKQFNRPAGTEIKHISNHWYLYERLSVYDKERKAKRKKSGRCLGAITDHGLVPSKRVSPLQHADAYELENREYGATAFLLSLTGGMCRRLAASFPDCWREIYALAFMKCKELAPFKRMEFHYQSSFLEQACGGLKLSAGRITELLRRIGTDREQIRTYMKGDLPSGGLILLDGHRIISGSSTPEYAHVGYDSRCRCLPQANILYLFSVQGCKKIPVYYKQHPGDVPDVTACGDTIEDSGLEKRAVTIVGAKGFGSADNEKLFDDASLGYLHAVRRDCAGIPEIPSSPDKYQKVFEFRGRTIYCNVYPGEKANQFLYYDLRLANDEEVDFICHREKANKALTQKKAVEDRLRKKGKGRLTQEEHDRLQPGDVAEAPQAHRANGIFILKTNRMELNCAQAYCLYKSRQDIEQAFKSYDDTPDAAASYMRNQYSLEGWLFLNHIALQMLYAVIDTITEKNLTDRYSFEDLMAFLKHVRVNKINGEWCLTKTTKHTVKLCKELGIEMSKPDGLQGTIK